MPESIGNKLKAARESRRLTLDQAADATRIRAIYLQGLENDDYSVMLSAAQGRGFLRLYTDFLGLNLDELTASARDSKPAASSAPEADSTPPAEAALEPVSVPEGKPARPGFWARLLRKEPPAKDESKSMTEPTLESLPVIVEEPALVSVKLEEEEPVRPSHKSSAKKPARKKTSVSEEKPKSTARKTTPGKKKRTLSRPTKR